VDEHAMIRIKFKNLQKSKAYTVKNVNEEDLVSDIPAEDGKIANFFYSVRLSNFLLICASFPAMPRMFSQSSLTYIS